jgi:hypothetical protein
MSDEAGALGPLFTLFIAGNSPNSRAASANLQRALAKLGENPDAVHIIDVFEYPEAASAARVLVTPTLLRRSDLGARILGDLSNPVQLVEFLRSS